MKVGYTNKLKGVISASTETSFLSWGETIDIRIKEKGEGTCTVEVKSNSKAQLFDWGTNEENEVEILDALSKSLS